MPEIPHDELTDHDYDGIREYDNPLPGWWKALFWGTFAFSILYWGWFHVLPGHHVAEAYAREESRLQAAEDSAFGKLVADAPTLVRLMHDQTAMAKAKNLFAAKTCATCHAPDGGGLPGLGVNFCDDYGKNFRHIEEIPRIIQNGVPGTAMVAQTTLSDNERILLAAYVASLRGTAPAHPKPPEGELLDPWPTE